MSTTRSKVAIVIPTRNEAAHIGALLDFLALQLPDQVVEIIVSDGGSTDGTQAIVRGRGERDARIRLLESDLSSNSISADVNRAVRSADASVDTIIRVDAHARYPANFVAVLLEEQAASGAGSVVNHMRSVGVSCFQRAVAAVSNSRFGTGGAAHRIGTTSGFIDHGHHALFLRAPFAAVGGYDESFFANEDAELDVRLRRVRSRIWFTNRATIEYFPRATPRALARQYYRYGRGRAMTWAEHRETLRPRQMVPPAMVAGVASCLALSPWYPALLTVPLLYAIGIAGATVLLVRQTRDDCVWGAAAALPIMHFCWGTGFIRQVLGRSNKA